MDDGVNSDMLLNKNNYQSNSRSMNTLSDMVSNVDNEEIRQAQTAFSDIIDKTCSNSVKNLFDQIHIPQDCFGFFFRSLVPTAETLQHDFDGNSSQKLFKYEDQDGIKYAFKVLDRRTNRLTYEQMPTYQKYGMRLLFTGPVQRELLLTTVMQNFFARETLRLGRAFDEPKSCKHIQAFIKMYQIDLDELLEPDLSKYVTFNEFFYRKLKPGARPIDCIGDPSIIVSAADCRLILFNHISDATRIWIKGSQFSLGSLFDDDDLAKEFDGGSIAVFRLAPADYHRFHSPVRGTIGNMIKTIAGTYYTVNPIAIRERLDVLTRNQRKLITIENSCFDKVAFVAVGALLVGSVNFTVQSNETVEKGDELGYFAYGGSTIVVVYKAGMVKWDEDLLHNSMNSMETLVRMGEHIGCQTSEEERRNYLLKASRANSRYSVIASLLRFFPTVGSVKK